MKLFSLSMAFIYHCCILASQVWARGSKVTTDGPADHIDQDPEFPTYYMRD